MESLRILSSIIIRYFAAAILLFGVICIFYNFFGVFFQKNKRKKCMCCICTIIALTICAFIYLELNKLPTNIRMKEDILYVHPKSEIQKDQNDIYDGSKDDPNLKEEEYLDDKETVHMKENTLYVHPKNEIKNNNLKQDTIQ